MSSLFDIAAATISAEGSGRRTVGELGSRQLRSRRGSGLSLSTQRGILIGFHWWEIRTNKERETRHQFTLEYWRDESWYAGRLVEVPGVFSQGATLDELSENIQEVYDLMVVQERLPSEQDT